MMRGFLNYLNWPREFREKLLAVEARIAALESVIPSAVEREVESRSAALLAAGWMARSQNMRALSMHPRDLKRPIALDLSIEKARKKLQELEPAVFPIWQQLHKNDDQSYVDDVQASCSLWDNKYARLFGAFLNLFAQGQLLDIGCGTNGLPSYSGGYPKHSITGMDPRPSRVPVDF